MRRPSVSVAEHRKLLCIVAPIALNKHGHPDEPLGGRIVYPREHAPLAKKTTRLRKPPYAVIHLRTPRAAAPIAMAQSLIISGLAEYLHAVAVDDETVPFGLIVGFFGWQLHREDRGKLSAVPRALDDAGRA